MAFTDVKQRRKGAVRKELQVCSDCRRYKCTFDEMSRHKEKCWSRRPCADCGIIVGPSDKRSHVCNLQTVCCYQSIRKQDLGSYGHAGGSRWAYLCPTEKTCRICGKRDCPTTVDRHENVPNACSRSIWCEGCKRFVEKEWNRGAWYVPIDHLRHCPGHVRCTFCDFWLLADVHEMHLSGIVHPMVTLLDDKLLSIFSETDFHVVGLLKLVRQYLVSERQTVCPQRMTRAEWCAHYGVFPDTPQCPSDHELCARAAGIGALTEITPA